MLVYSCTIVSILWNVYRNNNTQCALQTWGPIHFVVYRALPMASCVRSVFRTTMRFSSVALVLLCLTSSLAYKPRLSVHQELSSSNLSRLRTLLKCHYKDFFTQYYLTGSYWVIKNYVRAKHGRVRCYETVTITTHCTFDFLDNLKPLILRYLWIYKYT